MNGGDDGFRIRYQEAVQLITEAVRLDSEGNIPDALAAYQQGVAALQQLSTVAPVELRESLVARAAQYAGRAQVLAEATEAFRQQQQAQEEARQAEAAQFKRFFTAGEDLLRRAIGLEESKRQAEAISIYASAGEQYLKARDATSDPALKKKAVERATMIVSRGEEIKDMLRAKAVESLLPTAPCTPVSASPSPPGGAPSVVPTAGAAAGSGTGAGSPASTVSTPGPKVVAGRPRVPSTPIDSPSGDLTDAEKAVLRRSSFVNGRLFVPFMDMDVMQQWTLPKPYEDPDGVLPLAPKQARRLAGWKRPSEFMRSPRMITSVSPFSVTQELVSDCSFVASLCITAAYERRFHKQLITKIIYPQDATGQPVYNPSGKYMVKLHFNGVPRQVIVDDLLPVDERGKLLCSCSTSADELWVSIIEKAYMKLNGGYDFPGSNSGIDLFCLTGWVPEHMRFDDEEFNAERTWERLLSGAKFGDCLITIATGDMTEEEEKQWGLVQSHAYAVLDVKEVNGVRLLQVKNPWAHMGWKGKYSAHDTASWTPALSEALNYDRAMAAQVDNGLFWIDYDSVRRFYKGIYFNWNPDLFRHKQSIHAAWPLSAPGPVSDSYNLGYNPQYAVTINVPQQSGTCPLWLVLSRHETRKEVTTAARDREGRVGAGGTEADHNIDYLAMHVYSSGGRRVYYPRNHIVRGVYTNNPHALVTMQVPPGAKTTYTVVLSLYERLRDIDYTLHVFCQSPFSAVPALHEFQEVMCKGEFAGPNAGGNPTHPNFFRNPQFALTVPASGRALLRVETTKKLSLNVRLYAADGTTRVMSSSTTEVGSSGDYRAYFCCLEIENLAIGRYVALISTFRPGEEGPFDLIVGSVACKPTLRAMSAGLAEGFAEQTVRGSWSSAAGTAVGCANFGRYESNPRIRLYLRNATDIAVRIAAPNVVPIPSVNLAVFRMGADGAVPSRLLPTDAVVSTNEGVFSNPPTGLMTNIVSLPAGTYLMVPSTFEPTECDFEINVFTKDPTITLTRIR